MDNLKTKILLNIELTDPEMINKINNKTMELSLSLDDFILSAINKMLYDIEFVNNLRNKKA